MEPIIFILGIGMSHETLKAAGILFAGKGLWLWPAGPGRPNCLLSNDGGLTQQEPAEEELSWVYALRKPESSIEFSFLDKDTTFTFSSI